ncbi:cytochrome c [Burkholderia sp. Bp9126]|nr:cytochrome c [Burkholderia sp. Bp9126]
MKENHNDAQAREYAEPEEKSNPVPWLLGLVTASLLVWGVSYFLMEPGLSAANRQDTGAAQNEVAGNSSVNGGMLYTSNCVSCHQSSGAGMPGTFPPLAGSEYVIKDDKALVNILLRGVKGRLIVSGKEYNGVMPPFQTLSDAEIAAVATHIRASFGNKAGAVSAELVKEERAQLPAKAEPLTGDEILNQIK